MPNEPDDAAMKQFLFWRNGTFGCVALMLVFAYTADRPLGELFMYAAAGCFLMVFWSYIWPKGQGFSRFGLFFVLLNVLFCVFIYLIVR
jgi:hypothetical protein